MLQIHLFSLSSQRFEHFVRQIWTFCHISIDLTPQWWGAFPGRWIGGEICWCPKGDSRLECHTTSFRQGPRASQPQIHRRFQLQQQLHWRQHADLWPDWTPAAVRQVCRWSWNERPGGNEGQRVEFRTPKYAKILRIMQSQPSVTIDSLREQLGINKSAVQRLLSSLKEKGYIAARDYEGGWRVLITPSI